MRYIDVCSGISAPTMAWKPLGWKALCFAEIEPFPRAVLAHHYPDVPLNGDFTKIEGNEYGPVDLLVGGTPCQSFSVAGLRKGLEDDRGNLTLQFLKLAERTKPQWIVWENVPGVLSDKTGALPAFLDGLEELGYICDIDILDAQFYGVPQRRRRVFVCGQHRDHLIAQRTDSSALTIAQCWQETLHGILAVQSKASANAPESSALASLSRDGVTRRMKLFGLLGEADSFETLRMNLAAAWRRSAAERNIWAARLGASEKGRTADDQSTASPTASPSTPTEASLNDALAGSYAVMKSFITSTTTSSTTQTAIYTCSQAVLHIARLTLALNQSSPPFWSAASSSLTALRGFIDYARSTGSDLFAGVEWFRAWGDFLGQAVPLLDAFERIGIRSFNQVLPLADSLSGNPAPRREKGPSVAALTANGVGTCGADDNQGQAGHLLADNERRVFPTLDTRMDQKFGCNQWVDSGQFVMEPTVAHSLRGEGFDASEDGTGRGTPLVPVAAIQERAVSENPDAGPDGAGFRTDGQAYTLEARTVPQAVAFMENQRGELRTSEQTDALSTGGGKPGQGYPAVAFSVAGTETSGTLRANQGSGFRSDGSHVEAIVSHHSAVRRLTPIECERLQGFPDNFTLIPMSKRNKKAESEELRRFAEGTMQNPDDFKWSADGPRYKALGNSMAVPVLKWIGERIELVEAIA